MPGPVSDGYDPEFGTAENANRVREALEHLRQRITDIIGSDSLKDIALVVKGFPGPLFTATLSEKEWRLLRFAVIRGMESI